MTDEEILTLFFQRDENAIEQTRLKYHVYCEKIMKQILKDRQDREECWNEALLRVWNVIPPRLTAQKRGSGGLRWKSFSSVSRLRRLRRILRLQKVLIFKPGRPLNERAPCFICFFLLYGVKYLYSL